MKERLEEAEEGWIVCEPERFKKCVAFSKMTNQVNTRIRQDVERLMSPSGLQRMSNMSARNSPKDIRRMQSNN